MSSPDVYNYEMNGHGDIEEREAEALLAGRVAADDPRLGAFAELVLEVGRAFPEPFVEPSLEQEHVRAMMAAVAAPSQADDAGGLTRVAEADSRPWNTRVRTALKAFSASLAFKIVFGAAVAAMAVTGLSAMNEASRPDQDGLENETGTIGTGVDDFRLLVPPQDDSSEDVDGANDGSSADAAPNQGPGDTDRKDSDEESDDRSDDESEEHVDDSDDPDEDTSEVDDDERDDDSPATDDDEPDDAPDGSDD